MNLLITFILKSNVKKLEEFIVNIKNDYDTLVYILDFRKDKGDINIDYEGLNIKKADIDPEHVLRALDVSIQIARKFNIQYIMPIDEGIILNDDKVINKVVDILAGDNNIGAVYSDFQQIIGNYNIPVVHTGFPSKITSYPLIAFRDPPPELRDDSIPFFELISKRYIIKHIPEILCTIKYE